jgi:predicted phosphodiesterase
MNWSILIISLIFLATCKFRTSPYSADVPKLHLNSSAISAVKKNEKRIPEQFKIAVISDLHNYYEDLHDVVNQINQDSSYAFTVIVGDITNLGLREEYEGVNSILYNLKNPFLVTSGNHDLLTNGQIIFNRIYGESDFTFDFRDLFFVFFNSNNWETEAKVPDIDWVREKLSNSNLPTKILITHVSLQDRMRFSEDEISTWSTLFREQNVSYVLNGHDHNPNESPSKGTKLITVGSISKRVYLELIISPQGVLHKKISF